MKREYIHSGRKVGQYDSLSSSLWGSACRQILSNVKWYLFDCWQKVNKNPSKAKAFTHWVTHSGLLFFLGGPRLWFLEKYIWIIWLIPYLSSHEHTRRCENNSSDHVSWFFSLMFCVDLFSVLKIRQVLVTCVKYKIVFLSIFL